MTTDALETVWAPRLLSVLRIVAALIFMEHGTKKLFAFPPSDNPGPELFSLLGLSGVLELVGGALLVLGLFTRPVAFVLSGMMAVAYWMAHAPQSFFRPSTAAMRRSSTASCSSTWRRPAAAPGAWTISGGARAKA